jgi:hypothetical protein
VIFRTIPSAQWRDALDQLAREHRAWPATVDRNGRVEVRDEPLTSIGMEQGAIKLRLGERVLHVTSPLALRIEETQDGEAEALQLYEGSGDTVTLRFRLSERPAP